MKDKKLEILRIEVKRILDIVSFPNLKTGANLVNKCIRIGKIEERDELLKDLIKELKKEIIRVNNLKMLSSSNEKHLTHEARGYSRAIIILKKELKEND